MPREVSSCRSSRYDSERIRKGLVPFWRILRAILSLVPNRLCSVVFVPELRRGHQPCDCGSPRDTMLLRQCPCLAPFSRSSSGCPSRWDLVTDHIIPSTTCSGGVNQVSNDLTSSLPYDTHLNVLKPSPYTTLAELNLRFRKYGGRTRDNGYG
jgi:hypothetical protein